MTIKELAREFEIESQLALEGDTDGETVNPELDEDDNEEEPNFE